MGSFLLFSVPPWPPLWLMPMPVLLATVLVWATEVPLLEVWAMEVPLLEVPSLDMVWATEVPLLEVWDTEVPLLDTVSSLELVWVMLLLPSLPLLMLPLLLLPMLPQLLLPMLLSLLSMLSKLLLLSPLPVSTRPSRPTWFLRPVLLA